MVDSTTHEGKYASLRSKSPARHGRRVATKDSGRESVGSAGLDVDSGYLFIGILLHDKAALMPKTVFCCFHLIDKPRAERPGPLWYVTSSIWDESPVYNPCFTQVLARFFKLFFNFPPWSLGLSLLVGYVQEMRPAVGLGWSD